MKTIVTSLLALLLAACAGKGGDSATLPSLTPEAMAEQEMRDIVENDRNAREDNERRMRTERQRLEDMERRDRELKEAEHDKKLRKLYRDE